LNDADNDWRMQDVQYLTEDWISPWTGAVSPKGTQITLQSITQLTKKKQLIIVLPNATAICLSASKRAWKEAHSIRQASNIDKTLKKEVRFNSTAESFDYLERSIESIIMAFTALEAFVNENVPDDFEYHTHKKGQNVLEIMDKKDIERKLSLDEKLSLVLPAAKNIDSPKGSKCWQGYNDLKKIRNRIVHMKKEDRRSSGPEIPTLWQKLFKLNAPYDQAKDMVDFFITRAELEPRWHSEYNERKT